MTNPIDTGGWTAGPWRDYGLKVSSDTGLVATAHYGSIAFEQAQANARLIAVAPTLAGVLRQFVHEYDGEDHDLPGWVHEAAALARSALSRAEGRESAPPPSTGGE